MFLPNCPSYGRIYSTVIHFSIINQVIRRGKQEEHEVEYQQALVTVKEKIREVEGPDMKERMQDQIRQWFIECRYRLNSSTSAVTAIRPPAVVGHKVLLLIMAGATAYLVTSM